MKVNATKSVFLSVVLGSIFVLMSNERTDGRVLNQPKPTINPIETIEDTIPPKLRKLINAMIAVESRGNDSAYCAKENAVGCLQIRPIMVKEVNRILKRNNNECRYTLQDRWDRDKSIEMFMIVYNYYEFKHKGNFERVARNWNGGPNGYTLDATKEYWNNVKIEMI